MRKILLLFLLFASIVFFCAYNRANEKHIDSINVYYIKGPISPHVAYECGQISSMLPDNLIKDTVLTDEKVLRKIEKLIGTLDKECDDISRCDIRIECILNYIGGETKRICIGRFNCIKFDGLIKCECDSLGYIIKKHSGYYNYFEKRFLDQFKEIQQFGVPSDYDLIIEQHLPPPSVKGSNK